MYQHGSLYNWVETTSPVLTMETSRKTVAGGK